MIPQLKGYRRLRRVKCLHPHVLTQANGKRITVTRDKLLKTMKKMNERAKAGTLGTATSDHVVTIGPDGTQRIKPSSQVELLGFTAEYGYGKMKDGKEWLYCDVYAEPEKLDKIKKLPFTSVEYFPDDDVIANMAFTLHKPVLDVDTITPYHWEQGQVNDEGRPVPLVAYSVESRQGPVVVYSTEQSTVNPLQVFAQSIKEAAEALFASGGGEIEPLPINPEKKAASYSASGNEHPDTIELRAIRRRSALEALKNAGKNIDVDKEMAEWSALPEEAFQVHLKLAAACYSSASSGGARVEPIDGNGNANAALASRAQLAMQNVVKRGSWMNFNQCLERCRADSSWNGTTD